MRDQKNFTTSRGRSGKKKSRKTGEHETGVHYMAQMREYQVLETLKVISIYQLETETDADGEKEIREGNPSRTGEFETIERTVEKIINVSTIEI